MPSSADSGSAKGECGETKSSWGIEEAGIAKDFTHAEFVEAGFDGSGMIGAQAEAASGIGGGYGRRVAQSENGIERLSRSDCMAVAAASSGFAKRAAMAWSFHGSDSSWQRSVT